MKKTLLISLAGFVGAAVTAIWFPLTWAGGVGLVCALVALAISQYVAMVERTKTLEDSLFLCKRAEQQLTAQVKDATHENELATANHQTDMEQLVAAHNEQVYELEKQFEEYQEYAKQTNDQALKNLEAARAKIFNIDLPCAYCGHPQTIEFDLSEGQMTCGRCNNISAVHTSIFTARITEPIVDTTELSHLPILPEA